MDKQSTHGIQCFNPRSHEGSDSVSVYDLIIMKVSIHAPMKGATESLGINDVTDLFQSTLP